MLLKERLRTVPGPGQGKFPQALLCHPDPCQRIMLLKQYSVLDNTTTTGDDNMGMLQDTVNNVDVTQIPVTVQPNMPTNPGHNQSVLETLHHIKETIKVLEDRIKPENLANGVTYQTATPPPPPVQNAPSTGFHCVLPISSTRWSTKVWM